MPLVLPRKVLLAEGQGKPVERVQGAFSNPAHRRWRRRAH
jgi:hypothetical protein